MKSEWLSDSQAATFRAKHAGYMQERFLFRQADFGLHSLLLAQLQAKIEQARLFGANQPGERNCSAHIGQCIVCCLVNKAIGCRKVLQPERRLAIVWAFTQCFQYSTSYFVNAVALPIVLPFAHLDQSGCARQKRVNSSSKRIVL